MQKIKILTLLLCLVICSCYTFKRTSKFSYSEIINKSFDKSIIKVSEIKSSQTVGVTNPEVITYAPVVSKQKAESAPEIATAGSEKIPYTVDIESDDFLSSNKPIEITIIGSNLSVPASQTTQSGQPAQPTQAAPANQEKQAESQTVQAAVQAVETPQVSVSQGGSSKFSSSRKNIKERIKYLFVPTSYSDFDNKKLSSSLKKIIEEFKIDLVVITGSLSSVLQLIDDDFKSFFYTVLIFKGGVVLCNQDFISRTNPGYVEFENFVVQLYQRDYDEKTFSLNNPIANIYNSAMFDMLRKTNKPVILFASPMETSYFDTVIMQGVNPNNDFDTGTFVQDFEKNGFIDLFNTYRYTAPTIGLSHPGWTFKNESDNYRMDFVLAKDAIPVNISTMYIMNLSDSQKNKRYGIKGELAI